MEFPMGSCLAHSVDWCHGSWRPRYSSTIGASSGISGLPTNDDARTCPNPILGHIWSCASATSCLSPAGIQSRRLDMDIGASSHMTSDQGNLTNYSPSLLHNSSHIVVGNGQHLPILGSGSTHLRVPQINFLLAYVLHTPSLVSNLILVCKFTHDNWCSVEFDPFGFSVKDLITKTPILRSNSFGDLYPFTGFSMNHNNVALSTTVSNVDLWHRRLGHPSNASLSYLLSKASIPCTNNSSTPSVCKACHKGKHIRLPFYNSKSITQFPF
jgi:hypothetical protein